MREPGSRFVQLSWVTPSQEDVIALTKTCDYNSRVTLVTCELMNNQKKIRETPIVS